MSDAYQASKNPSTTFTCLFILALLIRAPATHVPENKGVAIAEIKGLPVASAPTGLSLHMG